MVVPWLLSYHGYKLVQNVTFTFVIACIGPLPSCSSPLYQGGPGHYTIAIYHLRKNMFDLHLNENSSSYEKMLELQDALWKRG